MLTHDMALLPYRISIATLHRMLGDDSIIRSARRLVKKKARPETGEKQGDPLFCKENGKNPSKSVDKEAGVWYYT
jgi:hypothetical protein